ncbi:site-specific integrase [Paraprevotella xylaniphila]|uniref:site-specific integrase n=1 Tax=Paraprevotella xylaniphila TaxID=454155 RepID=UPI0023F48645|nr:site-specific integrase [Paraprevotella xylaniphila]
MAKIKLYLDTRNSKRGEESPLKLAIRNKNTSSFIGLGISLLPSQWDVRTEKVISHPRRASYNAYISQRRLDAQEVILDLMRSGKIDSMSASDIKKHIEKMLSPDEEDEQKGTFVDSFLKFISEKSNPRTKEVYEYTISRIHKFCPDADSLNFEDVTKEWLTSFENFLAQTSPSKNARNIHLRNIRAVFNYGIDNELTTAYPFRKFKIRGVPTAKRSLTVDQLRTLFGYPVEPFQEQYLDMFKLIFFLIGINTVDLFRLKPDNLQNGRLTYIRAKTGRMYDIKVEPEAMEIINKYRGKNYLINVLDRYDNYKDYAKRLNDNLKHIGEVKRCGLGGKKVITPIFPNLTTYYARHTWATLAYYLDIPKETISSALGHEIGSRITSIYINFDQKKVDEANRKLIDYVLYDK